MTSDAKGLMSELIQVLHHAAMYNDKGYSWSGHNLDEREAIRAKFHQEMLKLVAGLETDALSPELVSAIASGAAARDDSGYFSELAQRSR